MESAEAGPEYSYSVTATNAVGMEGAKSEAKTITVASIEDLRQRQRLSNFSILTSRTATVKLITVATGIEGNHTITLIDMQGKVLAERMYQGPGEYIIPVSGFSNGVYFIQASGKNASIVRKFVLK